VRDDAAGVLGKNDANARDRSSATRFAHSRSQSKAKVRLLPAASDDSPPGTASAATCVEPRWRTPRA
jgi:hypothetical protein